MLRLVSGLFFVTAMLGGCGGRSQSGPVLQQYDGLRRQLQLVTAESFEVSGDTRTLGRRVALADTHGARAAAARLKRHALAFATLAGWCGNRVRRLAAATNRSVTQRYLGFVADALTAQWWEGFALSRMADLVWQDPMLTAGNDSERLAADVSWASSASRRAVYLTSLATVLRRKYSRAFRYVAIKRGR